MPVRLVLVVLALLALGMPEASAKPRSTTSSSPSGYDVSYPQCGSRLPKDAQFVVVGVDGGRVRSANPCLAGQAAWAANAPGAPAYYVNTGNPGPQVSSYWPSGQTSPRPCAATFPANDSVDCAYDYGWNNAQDSWSRAVAAGVPNLRGSWWLDVETGNSWETLEYGQSATYQANDLAVLQGQRDFLLAQGVQAVGVYSTGYQWSQVVGSATFGGSATWYAGVGSLASAQSHCGAAGFTGGPVTMVQFAKNGYDGDVTC
jgi:hypothetical protein